MAELLRVEGLRAGYGDAVVIDDVSFALEQGSCLALLGRNGAGKTTLIGSLLGLTRRHQGTIAFRGADITHLRPDQRAAAGMGWVPQERSIFKSLTVTENLAAVARSGAWTPERIFGMFPRLHDRRDTLGTLLSGGEQQMLAIGRALVLNPALLLLDEPLEGLAPIIAAELLQAITRLVRVDGMAAILIEQNPRKVLPITNHAIVLDRGVIVRSQTSESLLADQAALEQLLAVGRRRS
jgi:branched-chain amino acid transport system ATP-binding protein